MVALEKANWTLENVTVPFSNRVLLVTWRLLVARVADHVSEFDPTLRVLDEPTMPIAMLALLVLWYMSKSLDMAPGNS